MKSVCMIAAAVMFVGVGTASAADVTVGLKVAKATEHKISVIVTLHNNGKEIVGASPRVFKYTVTGPAGKEIDGLQQPDPKIADSQPVMPGKSAEMTIDLVLKTTHRIAHRLDYKLEAVGDGHNVSTHFKFSE